jgi:ATP-dependent helicase HrpA
MARLGDSEQLSRAKLRSWCKENFLLPAFTEWHDARAGDGGRRASSPEAQDNCEYASIHRALLAGLLRVTQQGAAHIWRERHEAFIHPDRQSRRGPPGSSAEQVETTKVYARNVARVETA